MKKRKLFIGLTMLFAATALFGMTACDSEGGSSAGGSSASGNSSIGNSSSGSSSGGSQSNTQIVTPVVSLPKEPFTITVRTDTVKITDSGRASQKMDKVLLSNYFNVKDAYNAGYTKLHVTFSFDVREIDDGYQYVFFYSDTNCKGNTIVDKIVDQVYDSDDPSLLYTEKLEHGSGKKDTSWGTHTFSTTLQMNLLKDDLYVRYGASGKNDDDWQNRNVVMTFELAK